LNVTAAGDGQTRLAKHLATSTWPGTLASHSQHLLTNAS